MNAELISKIQTLTSLVESMKAEKAFHLEGEQKKRSDFYRWLREQEIDIHQLKYQFSQQISALHQEAARLNQEHRTSIERLRGGGPLVSPQTESPCSEDTQLLSVSAPHSNPEPC